MPIHGSDVSCRRCVLDFTRIMSQSATASAERLLDDLRFRTTAELGSTRVSSHLHPLMNHGKQGALNYSHLMDIS